MLKKQLKYVALWLFLIGLIVIVFLQAISGRNITRLIKSNESLLHEIRVQHDLRQLGMDVLTIESDIRVGVITNQQSHFTKIAPKISDVKRELLDLNKLLYSKSTAPDIERLNTLVQQKLDFSNGIVTAYHKEGKEAAQVLIKTDKGVALKDSIIQVIGSLDAVRQHQLQQVIGGIEKSGTQARIWGFILAIVACLCVMLGFWYVVNQARQQQRIIEALNESEKKIKEAALTKEQFIANMSHEIRTPMNAILGFNNLLQRTALDDQQRNYVSFIRSSCENLLSLINDILDLSKIEAGMMHLEEAPFSLSGLINSIETMFADKAKQKNLSLNVHIEQPIPDTLLGDAVRLTQILINLLSNALKFTDEGGIAVTVKALKQTGQAVELCFSVKDTGIGIAPEKQQQIFERFRQADADTTRRFGGTGLGLSIVKQLAEAQGGSIRVKSKVGEGSEFIVKLQYKIAPENTIKVAAAPNRVPAAVKNAKVLVAEDNTMNQHLIKHLMKQWGMQHTLVQTGVEVLDTLKKNDFSLVLMDIQMPEMDGYMATQHIRKELKLNVPVIAMTAHAMAGEKEKCLSYGMNDYISKPLKEDELYCLIQKYAIEMPVHSSVQIIDLQYLKELSKGDIEFENAIIRQFIVQLPEELDLLQEAIHNKDRQKIKSLAHGMKSSVAYLGILDKLETVLHRMETEAVSNEPQPHFEADFATVQHVCNLAVADASQLMSNVYS